MGRASFPVDDWIIREEEFHSQNVPGRETIFSLGNGFLGIRGSYEEQRSVFLPGTYINGFVETEPITYGESAHGYAKNHQRMLNVTDATGIELFVDADPFDLATGTVEIYKRVLDLREGTVSRIVRWRSPGGIDVEIESVRLVSFFRNHLAVISWKCRLLNSEARLRITSGLSGNAQSQFSSNDPRIGGGPAARHLQLQKKSIGDSQASLRYRTRNTRATLVTSLVQEIQTENQYRVTEESPSGEVRFRYTVDAAKDVPVELNKYVAYYHSMADPGKRMLVAAKRDLQEARGVGVDRLRAEQKMYLSDFWQRSDVIIEGDPEIQQGIRFNLFHLLQAAGQNGRTNVPAKGLTGEGYDGHYFWDTEIYSLPFFIYTNPIIARRLLQYRYSILDAARERARELSHRGALFPWRTVLGEEASAYFPAGTAQYHIDADIVYAIRKYVEASGDFAFMLQYGAEICFETARFWTDLGDYIDGKGFCLNEVTGPNEYTTLINNNVFTNLMAQDNLRFAVSVAKTLERDYPSAYSRIAQKVDLEESERGDWARAADEMFVPIDRTRLIYPQDDSFFEKARWDFKSTPGDHYPLLLNYHPLIIYRHQVLKQPDLVLALFLQGGKFTYEDKLRNFHYYDPLTTGDSSLSPCVQSIVAAEIGETELALEYFMRTARMDLDDVNGNVHHGVHVANLAGTWMSLVYGFAGMRDESGSLSFRPRLPERWSRLRFRLHRHEAFFEVDIHRSSVAYRLLEGRPFRLTHFDESLVLGDPEKTLVLEIPQSRRPE